MISSTTNLHVLYEQMVLSQSKQNDRKCGNFLRKHSAYSLFQDIERIVDAFVEDRLFMQSDENFIGKISNIYGEVCSGNF